MYTDVATLSASASNGEMREKADVKQVQQFLNELNYQIDNVGQSIGELASKLRPVLREEPNDELVAKAAELPVLVPLADELRQSTMKVARLNRALEEMLHRLELE